MRLAMLSCPVRVVEPIYACDLQCDQSQLGNLYSVLSKRRGKVFKEDIIDGTTLFLLSSHLPVAESFGFAQELLKKTSGIGTAPQLQFSHWQIMEEDPFWRPTTAEELEDFGDLAGAERNMTRVCIDKVRKRKGLPIEEKVVVSAEKQRTLNKKK
jgi:ribosome assembly protein 1